MKYVSTRGRAPAIGFRDALLSGLAPDGGLYLPDAWPRFSPGDADSLGRARFPEAAARTIAPFAAGAFAIDELAAMAERAYAPFDHPDTAPLVALKGEDHLLELFHGPTLAFKDVAMRLLGQLYRAALTKTDQRKTIIGATSGDTGGAAIDAFAGLDQVDVYMLHPKGRISEVQRRIMTTVNAANIVNIAIDGSFDDCQRIVKQAFADEDLAAAHDLGGVNSINWVRLAIQTTYYFTSIAALGREASFVVPTGNFGDVFAGYVAKLMGAPVGRLGVAVNENDIMDRVLKTGEYRPAGVTPTRSPSMDIQVASNFERLIFEASGRDAATVGTLMGDLEREGAMRLPEDVHTKIGRDFVSARASEPDVEAMLKKMYVEQDMLVDPHTAVGLVALETLRARGGVAGPAIVLATAHPAKFPDAVAAATGVRPGLPERFSDLYERSEHIVEAPASLPAVKEIMLS